ncbi:MAG: HDOD domain-containing protein [Phycisphaerales bacterium]
MPPRPSQIELILRQVESLPTLSTVATRLLGIAGVEDADLDALVEIIESDPALSARLLGLCRRADKGWGDRITTVRRAVVMLGLDAVQAAALSVAVYDVMGRIASRGLDDEGPGPGLPFDRAGFWKFSIATATASELIAEAHPDLNVAPAEAFVAGLLHGLGKLALELLLPRSYARVLSLAERRQCAGAQAELEVLGLDHHTAGKRLGEHWGLPTPLRDVMWLYAQPLSTVPDLPHKSIIGLVGVARMLCRHLHLGFPGDFNHPEALDGPRGCCRPLGLRPELIEAAVPKLHEAVLQRARVLGLGEQTAPEMLMQSIGEANRRLGRMAGALDQRARAAQRQARVLAAVREFHGALGTLRPSPALGETVSEVVRSAAGSLGHGFYAAVVQAREGEAWQLFLFDAMARPTAVRTVEAPGPRGRCASLASLAGQGSMSFGALSGVPWLTDDLVDAPDLRRIQILPLITGADSGGPSWPAAMLLHDQDLVPWDRGLLAVLTSTWATAVAACTHHEGARRLGERLASSNRTLAEMQNKLAESESLARLGEMASGAAHEMNNPLTVISGRAQILAQGATGERDRAAAKTIVDATRHLTDLITSLRLVADPPEPRPAETPLGELLEEAIRRAGERVGVELAVRSAKGPDAGGGAPAPVVLDLPSPAPIVRVDRELIAGALAEIIANAVQASSQSPTAPVLVRAQTCAADSRLLIVTEDRGAGMSPRALQHAFDPFFSDLPAGRRTGLGLTRARRAVELHGGEIALAPRQGGGTAATLSLPGVLVSGATSSSPRANDAPDSGRSTPGPAVPAGRIHKRSRAA